MNRPALRPSAFFADRRGVSAVEFCLIAPVLVLLFLGCVTLFLAFSNSVTAEKASFTVADLLSRKTTVTTGELQTVDALFQAMLEPSHGATTFRVSSVKMANGALDVAWSWPRAPLAALKKADLAALGLPLVAEGDSVIVLETTVAYSPFVDTIGLSAGKYRNMVANRPRFTAAVVKSD